MHVRVIPGRYHPHVHKVAEESVLGGASGMIIVDGLERVVPDLAGMPGGRHICPFTSPPPPHSSAKAQAAPLLRVPAAGSGRGGSAGPRVTAERCELRDR